MRRDAVYARHQACNTYTFAPNTCNPLTSMAQRKKQEHTVCLICTKLWHCSMNFFCFNWVLALTLQGPQHQDRNVLVQVSTLR